MTNAWKKARFLGALLLSYASLCLAQRLLYAGWIFAETGVFPAGLAVACLKGVAFDLATSVVLFLPLTLFLLLLPQRWRGGRGARGLAAFLALAPLAVGLLSVGFELFFWEEFRARYNFIAVDYLVYTHEVLRNIWESYPVVWFFAGFGAVVGGVAWVLRRTVRSIVESAPARLERSAIAAVLASLLALNISLNEDRWLEQDPFWGRELAKNSLFALFSAYNRNAIDYRQFYVSMAPSEADRITAGWLAERGPSKDERLWRAVRPGGPEKRWNVVLVAIESMSARFLGRFGNKENLTPNLDRMAGEGIFFTKLYATGTRTVRGLEALMLSLPPTPGQSILRRPDSDRLFSLGSVFQSRGYVTQFVYGGYGGFDNMGPWFSSNGFEIVDRSRFAPGGVTFATAWGACDEDLFHESLRRADSAHSEGKPFLQVVLTTSNHRPYDYPEGRIDIKSHTGRAGAVKYTDFAIGQFVEQASRKAWYKDTLFIFAADHNASVAGGTDIPVGDYLIPVIFHNPGLVKPLQVEKLASQIDIAPTLLSLMGFSYKSWFFGQDLLTAKAGRALLGTYQKVALMEPGRMAILEPGQRAQLQELGPDGRVTGVRELPAGADMPDLVRRAAAVYQSASDLFRLGLSKQEKLP